MQKLEFLNLEPKNTLFKCFGQQFWKDIVIFDISTLEFALLQSFVQKIKILCQISVSWDWNLEICCHFSNQRPRICLVAKFGAKIQILKFVTKNAWFGCSWTWSWKLYCHIWTQHPRLCLIAKFREKMKMAKFGTKNALFGNFWVIILKRLLSYFKWAPLNLLNCKILWRKKNA